MILGLFQTVQDSIKFLEKKKYSIGDRIIITGEEQTTYERTGNMRQNIIGIYLQGKDGEDGLPGKPGKRAEEVNLKLLENRIYERLRDDQGFIKKCEGKKGDSIKGDPGETIIPNIKEIVEILLKKLIDNKEFIEKVTPKPGKPGKDGKTPVKGIDYFDGEDGKTPVKGEDYDDGVDGNDGHKLVFIEDPNNVNLKPNEFGIDINKNFYIYRNNSILKL